VNKRREKDTNKKLNKMSEKCKEQSEMQTNEKRESKWVSKAVPFIVCDISLERFCTAGILSEFENKFVVFLIAE
jgi:hypothetical protein